MIEAQNEPQMLDKSTLILKKKTKRAFALNFSLDA